MLVGGKPRKDPSNPGGRTGKQGHTTKTPVAVAVAVERPNSRGSDDDQGPTVIAMPVTDQSAATLTAALSAMADSDAHIMSDSAPAIARAAADRPRPNSRVTSRHVGQSRGRRSFMSSSKRP